MSRDEQAGPASPAEPALRRTRQESRRELLLLLGGARVSLDLRRLGLPPDQRRKLAAALATDES